VTAGDMRLVELAAKAAGYGHAAWSDDGRGLLLTGIQEPWNPLEDDGDALRLAVRLQMDIFVRAGRWTEAVRPLGPSCKQPHERNQMEATRRAIVRAAVEGR
jgi:hypothetical protein